MEQLTTKDIEVLMEALTAWEHKDELARTMIELTGPMIGLDSGNGMLKATIAAKQKEATDEIDRAKTIRGERSILLKGKLLRIRDQVVLDQVAPKVDG